VVMRVVTHSHDAEVESIRVKAPNLMFVYEKLTPPLAPVAVVSPVVICFAVTSNLERVISGRTGGIRSFAACKL
jgi:hypothetical protein